MELAATTPTRSVSDLREPRGLPLLGHVRDVLARPGRFLLDGYRAYGPVLRLRVFGIEIVAMLGPEANRLILAASIAC